MSKVSLKFWKNGEPFEPIIYPDDLARYDDEEAIALANKKRSAIEVIKAQARFVQRILEQSFPGEKADLKLTVAQIRGATFEFLTTGQDWREPEGPLASGGEKSPPSSSQASPSTSNEGSRLVSASP